MIIYALIERAAQRGRNSLFPPRLEISRLVQSASLKTGYLGIFLRHYTLMRNSRFPSSERCYRTRNVFATLELAASNKRKPATVLPSSLLYPTACVKWDTARLYSAW